MGVEGGAQHFALTAGSRFVRPLLGIEGLDIHSQAELDLLQALRSGEFDRIEVRQRDGLITYIGTEGEIAPEELTDQDDTVTVKRRSEFETLVVNSQDGEVVSVRRRLPKKYTKAENEPFIVGALDKSDPRKRRKK